MHKRFFKVRKIVRPEQLIMKRSVPYIPTLGDRRAIQLAQKLEDFERSRENGVMFVAEKALPPWKRTIRHNLLAQRGVVKNFNGLRVRGVNKIDEPGFPTIMR